MDLSPADYLRVRVASQTLELAREKRRRLDLEAARLEDVAMTTFIEALRAAGVDHTKTWRFNDTTMTLEEVPDSTITPKAPTTGKRNASPPPSTGR